MKTSLTDRFQHFKDQDLSGTVLHLLLLIGVLNLALTSFTLIDYSYDLDYSEGFVVENTERLVDTGNLYTEPSFEDGYKSVKYTPLYYFVMSFTSLFLGIGFLSGRIINLVSVIGVTLLIWLIYRLKTDSKMFLIPLLFLAPYLTIFTSITIRTDMLALLFSLGGLYFFLKNRIYVSSSLFLLAFFTKQSFVAGFLAVSLYLLLEKNNWKDITSLNTEELLQKNRELLMFCLIYVSGILGGLGLLYLWSPHVISNVFLANTAGFEVRWDLINWLHLTFLPVFGLSVYYLSMFRDKLLGFYLFFSASMMMLQFLRGGAWVYAAVQFFAACILCVSVLYSELEQVRDYLNYILILQLLVFFTAPMISGSVFDMKDMASLNEEADRKISEHVAAAEGDVFVEHIGYEISTGSNPSPEIWGFYEQYSADRISETDVERFFQERNYTKIITYKRLDNLPVEEYLSENYELVDETERRDMLLNREHWRVYEWRG